MIEVLMAVAILATLVIMILGSMQGSLRMQQVSKQLNDTHMMASTTLRRMVSEINMAFFVSEASEDVAQNREIRYRTIFEGKRDSITFTTMGYQQRFSDESAGDQAAISYRIERRRGRDGRTKPVLIRREEAPIDERPERGGRLTVVLEDVESIRFEYWDPDREIGDDAWVDQWDPKREDGERLPDRVRITLEVTHPVKPRERLSYRMEADIQLEEPLLLVPAEIAEQLSRQRREQDAAMEDAGINPAGTRQNQPNLRDQVRQSTGRR